MKFRYLEPRHSASITFALALQAAPVWAQPAAPAAPPAAPAATPPTATPPPAAATAPAAVDASASVTPAAPATTEAAVTPATAAVSTPEVAPTPVAPSAPAPAPEAPAPVVAAPPAPVAPAALPVGLVVTGDFWSRYELRDGYAVLGAINNPRFRDGDATFYRARFGLATTPLDIADGLTAMLQFTPQASGYIPFTKQNSGYSTPPPATATTPPPDATLEDKILGLHEGYFRLASKSFRLDVGRFEMVYGEHLIIGNLAWHQTGRAFDGARVRVPVKGDSGAYVDAFFTQPREGYPQQTLATQGDLYFSGVYAGLGALVTPGLDLDVYFLQRIFPHSAAMVPDAADATMMATVPGVGDPALEATLGARIKQKVAIVDYRAEGGIQFGQRQATRPAAATAPTNPDVFAYSIDGEVGVNVWDDGLRLGIGGLVASGNDNLTPGTDEGWNHLFPTVHRFLGLMDVFGRAHSRDGIGRSNVGSGNLHIALTKLKPVTINIDGHLMTRLFTTASSNFAGGEVDTNVTWQIGKGLGLRGLYGFFIPNADHYGSDRIANFCEIQLGYTIQ